MPAYYSEQIVHPNVSVNQRHYIPMNDMYCLGVYVYAFYPIPLLYIQIEHKLASSDVLSTFSREMGKNNIFMPLQVSDKIQDT